MKKILFLTFIVCLSLAGCNGETEPNFSEGIYPDKNWNNIEFPINDIVIQDKETAINIAYAIFLQFQNQGEFPGYTPELVFHDTEDDLWIISFWEDKEGLLGSDFTVVLNAENGEVVKMWIGE